MSRIQFGAASPVLRFTSSDAEEKAKAQGKSLEKTNPRHSHNNNAAGALPPAYGSEQPPGYGATQDTVSLGVGSSESMSPAQKQYQEWLVQHLASFHQEQATTGDVMDWLSRNLLQPFHGASSSAQPTDEDAFMRFLEGQRAKPKLTEWWESFQASFAEFQASLERQPGDTEPNLAEMLALL